MRFALPHYQAASENFSSSKTVSGRGEKKEQEKKAFAYASVRGGAKWEGKASFGDVSLQLPGPGFQEGSPRGDQASSC